MRLGLIGSSGHWRSYADALRALPEVNVAAVATAAPDERLAQFDDAPGVTAATRRCDSPAALLASGVDVVQVSTRADLAGRWVRAALERGLPAMAEKPLAFTLDELHALYEVAQRTGVPLSAMHAQRGTPLVGAVREAVRGGAIGRPLVAHNQKSYKWGTRPESYRDRSAFPGIAPWIGIHVFDWLLWILGDRFEEVGGLESPAARPEYAACASNAAYLFRLNDGGMATVTLDYLRPDAAPTHGDERIRIAGTAGVVEVVVAAGTGTIIDAQGLRPLPVPPGAEWYAGFLCAALGEVGPHGALPNVLPQWEVFRATEIALKAQVAADTGRPVDLRQSPYRPRDDGSTG